MHKNQRDMGGVDPTLEQPLTNITTEVVPYETVWSNRGNCALTLKYDGIRVRFPSAEDLSNLKDRLASELGLEFSKVFEIPVGAFNVEILNGTILEINVGGGGYDFSTTITVEYMDQNGRDRARESSNIEKTFVRLKNFEPGTTSLDAAKLDEFIKIVISFIPELEHILDDYANSPERTQERIYLATEKLITDKCVMAALKDPRYIALDKSNPFQDSSSFSFARQLEPDNPVLEVIKKVHNACEPFSLVPGALEGGEQIPSDYGVDLFTQAAGIRQDNPNLESFDSKANFSALALHLAWLSRAVGQLPSSSEGQIKNLPEGTEKYYGFNLKRDSQKAMSWGSGIVGRFESSMSRKVVVCPIDLDKRINGILETLVEQGALLETDKVIFKQWWDEEYIKPIRMKVEAALVYNELRLDELKKLKNALTEEYRLTYDG